ARLGVSVGISCAALLTEDEGAWHSRSRAIACGLPGRKIRRRRSAKYQGPRAFDVAPSLAPPSGKTPPATQRGAGKLPAPRDRGSETRARISARASST